MIRLVGLVVAANLVSHGVLLAFGLPVAGWEIGLLDAAILAALSAPLLAWALTRRPQDSAGRELAFRVPVDPAVGLRWVTLTALGLVASLGAGTYFTEQRAAESTATYSQLIHLAGYQRLLSQRIARFAARPTTQTPAEADQRIEELFGSLRDLHESFDLLKSRIQAEAAVHPSRIQQSLLRLTDVDARYAALVDEIRDYLAAELDEERVSESASLIKAADEFMIASHETVLSLQSDFEQFLLVEKRRRLELGILMLGMIAAVYLLMIDPAIRHLRRQHRAVHARAAELHRLALVAQMTTDAVLITDDAARIVWGNASWSRISGTATSGFTDRPLLDVLRDHRGDPSSLSDLHSALESGMCCRTEMQIVSTSGEEHRVEAEIQPLRETGGPHSGFIVVLSDITRLRKERARLVEQVRLLEEAEESASLGHWSRDLSTGTVHWSAQIFRIHRLEPADQPPAYPQVLALYDSESGRRLDEAVNRALATGDEIDLVLRTSDADERYVAVSGSARYDAAGQIGGLHGTVQDITTQVLADRLRLETEERYRQLADSIPTMTWLSGPDKGCTDFNKAWLEFRGSPLEAEQGEGWTAGLHPEDFDRCLTAYRTAFDARTPYAATYRLRRCDGVYRWIETRGVARYSASGEFLGYAGGCIDITALKESQQQLRESEQFLERAGQVAAVGGWELDLTTRQVRWTEQTCRIHDVPLDFRPTLEAAIAFYAPEARPLIQAAVETAIATGEPWDLELPLVTATGRSIWVRAVGQAEFQDGRAVRLYGAFQDVTRRKHAESEAVHASALVRGVLDAASEFSIIAADPLGLITIFNRGAERLLGYSAREMIGKQTPMAVHQAAEVAAREQELSYELGRPVVGFRALVELAERSGSERREWTYVRKDGTCFPVSLTVNVIRTELGEVVGYLGIAHDISVRQQVEESLLATNRSLEQANHRAEEMAVKAEESNRLKSEFLANMSHEIRTPMTAIMGYTELLAEIESDPLQREQRLDFIGTIRRNGEHLLALINDILDVSKIEAGKMTVERVATHPAELLREVQELMFVKAQAKGIAFNVVHQGQIPAVIESDPVRLKQILVNLVSNAIKFTELGRVTVIASFEPDGSPGPALRYDVEDTGIGMNAEQQGLVFEAFQQADATTTRKFGGTGLGLRISRRLAKLLGGDIAVRSQPGQGSVFTVRIAAVIPQNAGPPSTDRLEVSLTPPAITGEKRRQQPLEGVRILFAEDGPDNQRLISYLLRKAGAEVRLFENGKLALESLTTDGTIEGLLNAAPGIDVILTDMQMPEMDGYSFARSLRAKACPLPIVALTANAMGGDAQKCLDAGCDCYASKPIEHGKLIETLLTALELRSRQSNAAIH